MKKILFVASECVPFIKTGGLADVVGSLPKELDPKFYDVRVIIPKYSCMKQEYKDKLEYITNFYMDFNWKNEYVGLLKTKIDNITYYFIDNEQYFTCLKPYTEDPLFEIERFSYFSKAVLSSLPVKISSLILFTVMTGRQVLFLFTSKSVFRIIFSSRASNLS